MRGGTLDQLVRLQRLGLGQDDGTTTVPGEFADLKPEPVWASERSTGGTERFASQEVAANQLTIWRIRWDPDLDDLNPKDRLIREADGEEFNILNVDKIGRQDMIEITTITRTDD